MLRKQLIKANTLSKQEYRNISNLIDECAKHDRYTVRVYWNIIRDRQIPEFDDFLFYVDNKLVGYVGMFVFKDHEAELTAAVHPRFRRQNIFSRLFTEAFLEYRRRDIRYLLFICHRAAKVATAFSEHHGGQIDHTEIEMTLTRKTTVTDAPKITLRKVTKEDLAVLARIDMAAFGTNPNKIYESFAPNLGSLDREAWIARNEAGEDVAKLHLRFDDNQSAYIHDLCVLPEQQRKHYGSALVNEITQLLRRQNRVRLFLDVLSTNDKAIMMYQGCGYEISSHYDLWRIDTTNVTLQHKLFAI